MRKEHYERGRWYGRRNARYARLLGRMPFVCISVAEVRAWSRANSHRDTSQSHRAYWLGYARGLTA
jgi:hypothetical protein